MRILFGERAGMVRAAPMMSFLIPRATFIEVGQFSEASLPAAEDWEFCHRFAQAGKTLFYDPSVRIVHRYQREESAVAERIRRAGAMGVYACAAHYRSATAYVAFSVLRFITSPLWLPRHYPSALYGIALRMEALFCQARVAAYFAHLRGR